MKGQLSVNPTFKPLNIRKPTIYSQHPLVAFDGHRLHLNQKSILWSNKNIINAAYNNSLSILMILCSDWKLYIYNNNLDLIAKLSDWQSKYSVGFEYVQRLSMFILVGVIEIQTLKVNIKTNLKQTKFLSSVKFNIERKQLRMVQQKNRLTWNKGYGYDINQNLLYVWSTQNINFYSLNKLELKSAIVKLVKKQNAITYVHLNRSYKYTITGLINGNIKVWRLPLMQVNSSTQYIMIHNCIYHTKTIEKIIPSNDDRIIISSSEDLTLCLWSLQTFQLLRVYNFEGEYTQLYLVDHKRAFAIQNNELGQLTFGKTMEFILQIDSSITNVDKLYNNDRVTAFQITLQSNVGLQILSSDMNKKDLNKIDISYFYPPLKAQSIKQVLSSPYDSNIYYMLVENGELFSLRIQNNSSKIQQSFSLQHIHDCQNHSLNQTPTYIAFLPLCDIEYDSEITQNSFHNRPGTLPTSQKAFQQMKLITIGCNKGSIVILSLDHIQKIRTRLTYHRQSIIAVQSIYNESKDKYFLASMCTEDYLRLIELQNDKAHCFYTINCQNSLKFIKSFQNHLALVFKRGIFEIAHVNDHEDLKIWQNLDSIDHQGQIYSLDYQKNHKLIMTSGGDNRIKIWSRLKILIFQIKLDEGLKYTIWSNDLQIFVSHRNKLLYLRDISISTENIEDQDVVKEEDKRFNAIAIKDFFIQFKRDLHRIPNQHYIDAPIQVKQPRKKAMSQNKSVHFNDQQLQTKNKVDETTTFSIKAKKSKNKERTISNNGFNKIIREEEEMKKRAHLDANLKATRKHLDEVSQIKKITNQSLLPKIQPKIQDKFQEFINAKLISKKMLTRRDITLNRIIMKNLIKQQFSQEQEQLSSLKLDF